MKSTTEAKPRNGTDGKPIPYMGQLSSKGKEQFHAREGVDPLSSAFERKTTIHAGMFGETIAQADIPARYADALAREHEGTCAAYLHIPFCETHCLYCGFYSAPYRDDRSGTYTDALIAELEMERDAPAVRSRPIQAVYFGGGTPTSLKAEDLYRLLRAVRDNLPLADDCEVTVEGRILNFGEDKMRACIDGGANRFSLGVQTFDTTLRRQLGRSCDQEEVRRTLTRLKKLSDAAVIIDLIYGLPGQTMDSWHDDIAACRDLGLDGADLYQLNVYPGGRLEKAIKNGSLPAAADIPGQSAFFAAGVAQMESYGMRRLSITHWSAHDRERNLYNPLMKSKSDCLAYGAGAGGMLGGVFFYTERDYKAYLAARSGGEKPVVMMTDPPANMEMVKTLTAQLERGSLDLDRTADAAGLDATALFTPLLQQWEKAGLLHMDGNRIELTLAGQFWQVNITQALIDWHKLN